jgi:hypothetical protein
LASRFGVARAKSRGGAFGEERGRQHGVEAADVARELGEAQVHQAVELADPVVEVLADAVAVADQLAQRLGDFVVRLGGLGALLEGEAGDARGADRVRLGALEGAVLEAAGLERVEQGHVVAGGHQGGVEVLPVVPRGLHGDQRGRRPEQAQQRVVAFPVPGDGHRHADRRTPRVQTREHMAFGGDVDPGEHGIPSSSDGPGASEPASMPALVQARTAAMRTPPDTVRARNAGRGRQSHCRGRCLNRDAATLSQRPPHQPSREVRR